MVPSAQPAPGAPENDALSVRIVAGLFFASALMVPLGMWLRPVQLQWWDFTHFAPISAAMDAWIWSFRILVFGLFLRVGALAALNALPWASTVRPLLSAGVTICTFGLLVSALGQGYYMDTGCWGSWAATQKATPEAQAALVDTLLPVNAWGECLLRMGSVFFSLGALFLAAGWHRAQVLVAWLAPLTAVLGVVGIVTGMFLPNEVAVSLGVGVAQSAWSLAVGVVVAKGLLAR